LFPPNALDTRLPLGDGETLPVQLTIQPSGPQRDDRVANSENTKTDDKRHRSFSLPSLSLTLVPLTAAKLRTL
jgi:hypothetical protein